MKLDELLIIQILKDNGIIKNENDIAEIKTDDGNVFIKFNEAIETATVTVEVE